MRLVCPNCGAQYEVDDRVIPESGRDVQCSSCGHAWYQMPFGHDEAGEDIEPPETEEAPAVDEELLAGEEEEAEEGADEALEAALKETLGAAGGAEAAAEEAEEPEEAEPEPEEEAPAEQPERRGMDQGVRSILQEEAERELDARAAEREHEPEPVESQPDLGLDAGLTAEEERRRIARERMARMRGDEEEEEPAPDFEEVPAPPEPEGPAHRRDLFPDIEEINSTLENPPADTAAGEALEAQAKGGGFTRGFSLVIFLAALALSIYILAPGLGEKVPAIKPFLTAYVDAINATRVALDEFLRGLIAQIEEKATAGQ